MTRSEAKQLLINLGIAEPSEEQITNYLNSVHGEVKKESDKLDAQKAELDRLKEIEKDLEAEKNKNLTAEEKVQKALADAEKAKLEFSKQSNQLAVEKIFVAAGLTEEDYKEFIGDIVSDNAELSTKLANSLVATITKQKDTAIQKTKEELLDKTPTPGGDGGNGGDSKTEDVILAESLISSKTEASKTSQVALDFYSK